MHADPMDEIPEDHGSDRYHYVEIDAPEGIVPRGPWWDRRVEEPCPDCQANLFAKWVGVEGMSPADPIGWALTYAHDDGCPRLAEHTGGSA